MTTIYFVRHAEPDYSVHEDSIRPLTGEGLKRAQDLAELFDSIHVDVIYSSPYKRSLDTVLPIAKAKQLTIKCHDDLRERKMSGDVWIEYFSSFARQQWEDFGYRLEGGESLDTVQKRNISIIDDIIDEHKSSTIIVGTHGTALSTVLQYYDNDFGYEDFERFKSTMPWIVRVTYDQRGDYVGRDMFLG